MNKENISSIIHHIILDTSYALSIKDGELTTIPQKESNSNNKEEVINFLKEHKSTVQDIFNDEYFKGIEVIKFQNYINIFYASPETPNFLKETTSNWTSLLQEKGIEVKLLPGTHNSGANDIDFFQRPIFMESTGKKILYSLMKLPGIKTIVKHWTVNQEHSILEQLEDGIRLFDFRLGKSSDDTLYLTHTFLTTPFNTAIEQLEKFSTQHPKEKIVIHLKSDYEHKEYITLEDILKAKEQINKINKTFINNHIHEEWPDKSKIQEVKTFMNDTSFSNNSYLSLNTTPNIYTILKKLFTGSLIKDGQIIQEQLGDQAIELLNKKNAIGVIVDSPTHKFIQHVIYKNYTNYQSMTDDFRTVDSTDDGYGSDISDSALDAITEPTNEVAIEGDSVPIE